MPENENNHSPKKKRGFLWAVIIILIILLAAVIGGYAYYQYFGTPSWLSFGSTGTEDTAVVAVEEEATTAPEATETHEVTEIPEPESTKEPEATATPEATEEPTVAAVSSYIGVDAAAEAALNHSKVNEKDADFSAVMLEEQYQVMVYEVKFQANDVDYEYMINATTGGVESWRKTTNANEGTVAVMSEATASPTASPTPSAEPEKTGTILISESEAKELAMAHANIKESDLSKVDCTLELDGLSLIYDVEMQTKLMKYDYEVDAITGDIVSFEVEAVKK
jgi:uncharacterized membrane protein YkoI